MMKLHLSLSDQMYTTAFKVLAATSLNIAFSIRRYVCVYPSYVNIAFTSDVKDYGEKYLT